MSDSKEPPHLPDVVDEAGATPGWVPLLGVGLLCLFALVIALRQAVGDATPPDAAAAVADGGVADEAQAGTGQAEAPTAVPAVAPGH